VDSREQKLLELALRYGADLPKPKKPKLRSPGFFVGACNRLMFSPDGEHLFASTHAGYFFWDVQARKKISRIRGITNPWHFAFSEDGSELLMRNEYGQFARISVPDGRLISKFKAYQDLAAHGECCFGPDRATVMQMFSGGKFALLDAESGRPILSRQLESTGVDAQIFWRRDSKDILIFQSSVANWRNLQAPCAYWRWRWPLDENEPERMAGQWVRLLGGIVTGTAIPFIHHHADPMSKDGFVIDFLDADTLLPVGRTASTGSNSGNFVAVSPDGTVISSSEDYSVRVVAPDFQCSLPVWLGRVEFHPTSDLVAVTGEAGLVAPVGELTAILPSLQVYADLRDLRLRTYSSRYSQIRKSMPESIQLFSTSTAIHLQPTFASGSEYLVAAIAAEVDLQSTSAELGNAVLTARNIVRGGPKNVSLSDERRRPLRTRARPFSADCQSAAVVAFGPEAIEIWPQARGKHGEFEHDGFPVVAIPLDSDVEKLGTSLKKILNFPR
jgi:hypothetical protein